MRNIQEILVSHGIQTKGVEIKIVRHVLKTRPHDIRRLVPLPANKFANFRTWQRIQEVSSQGARLRACRLFVSCCYLPKKDGVYRALFAGVFYNDGGENPPTPYIERYLSGEFVDAYRKRERCNRYFLNLRRDPRFAGLEGRVIVEWGRGTASWVQNHYPNDPKGILKTLDAPRGLFADGHGS